MAFDGEMVNTASMGHGITLTFSEVKILRFWQKHPLKEVEKVLLSPELHKKFLDFLIVYLKQSQGIELVSRNVLED